MTCALSLKAGILGNDSNALYSGVSKLWYQIRSCACCDAIFRWSWLEFPQFSGPKGTWGFRILFSNVPDRLWELNCVGCLFPARKACQRHRGINLTWTSFLDSLIVFSQVDCIWFSIFLYCLLWSLNQIFWGRVNFGSHLSDKSEYYQESEELLSWQVHLLGLTAMRDTGIFYP